MSDLIIKPAEEHLYTEARPWGTFTVLRDLPHCKVKHLTVNPGSRLSLQMHHHREEHWIVVKGAPEITVGEKNWQAQVGETIFIPKEAKHRLGNSSDAIVEIVEVQLGQSFSEEDIVRFEDDYKRV